MKRLFAFFFAIALSSAATAQIQVFSSGFSGTPETISLAPIGFGSAAGKYVIPDVANSNILVVNPTGGPPSIFLAGQGGLGGIFLPTGWGANSGKYLFAGQPINQMDILDGTGNYTPFDPLNANFTTPASAPTAFSASGSVFITDQNQFIWTAAPSGGGVLLFKDLHSDPFLGTGAPFGIEFTPVGWTTGTPTGNARPSRQTVVGGFGNRMLVSASNSGAIVAIDPAGNTSLFASIGLKAWEPGLRQMLLAPDGFFQTSLGLHGPHLILSVSGSGQGGGMLGETLVLGANGAIAAHLKVGSVLAKYDPRGMILINNNTQVLISDTSDPILLVSPSDFALGREDQCAPRVTSSVAVSSLWPPNGKFVNVGLSAGVTDNCPSPSLSVSVFSNEAGQAIHLAPGSLELASKRDGGGGGRVYLIVVRATDALNYSAISCNTVTVPHDQSAGSKNDVTAQAAAAQSFCSLHGGAAPNGYSLTQ